MISRIWIAFRIELKKVLKQRFIYISGAFVLLASLSTLGISAVHKDQSSDYDYVVRATSLTMNWLIPLMTIIFGALSLSAEYTSGALRFMLVRPLRRVEYLYAKILVTVFYAVTLTALAVTAAWVVIVLKGDLAGVYYGGEVLFTNMEIVRDYALGCLTYLLPLSAAATYAVFLSTVVRNTGTAVGSAIGLWVVFDALKYPLRLEQFMFTSYTEFPWRVFVQHCQGIDSYWRPGIFYCVGSCLAAVLVFLTAASLIFRRQDIP